MIDFYWRDESRRKHFKYRKHSIDNISKLGGSYEQIKIVACNAKCIDEFIISIFSCSNFFKCSVKNNILEKLFYLTWSLPIRHLPQEPWQIWPHFNSTPQSTLHASNWLKIFPFCEHFIMIWWPHGETASTSSMHGVSEHTWLQRLLHLWPQGRVLSHGLEQKANAAFLEHAISNVCLHCGRDFLTKKLHAPHSLPSWHFFGHTWLDSQTIARHGFSQFRNTFICSLSITWHAFSHVWPRKHL